MSEHGDPRINLHQLLKTMIEKGASDMHITTGTPPLLRVDGDIVPLKLPALGPVETKALCFTVLTEERYRSAAAAGSWGGMTAVPINRSGSAEVQSAIQSFQTWCDATARSTSSKPPSDCPSPQ